MACSRQEILQLKEDELDDGYRLIVNLCFSTFPGVPYPSLHF